MLLGIPCLNKDIPSSASTQLQLKLTELGTTQLKLVPPIFFFTNKV